MLHFLKNTVKFALLDRWRIPYSQISSVPPCVFDNFRYSQPITLVDVGAYKGHFTLGLEALCKVKAGVLIEPNKMLAQGLRENDALSRFRIEECALADFDGDIEMHFFPGALDMSSALDLDRSSLELVERSGDEVQKRICPARQLDTILADFSADSIDLLKIDVQGLEHLVLKGAACTLARTKAVYTEVSFRALYEGSSVFHEIYTAMMDSGFMMRAIETGYWSSAGELLQGDVLFVNPTLQSFSARR